MQLSHERPDYAWVVRGADARHVRVNDRVLERSFALAPDHLLEDWAPPASAVALEPAHLQPLLALSPELVVLGTGGRQVFPPPAVLAACLTGVTAYGVARAAGYTARVAPGVVHVLAHYASAYLASFSRSRVSVK